MTINHTPIQSGLPFIKSIQVNEGVGFNFINKDQVSLFPNHCQFYEHDGSNPSNNDMNYHFLQVKCDSGDFSQHDVNLFLHYQNQHQHLQYLEQQRQESSMPSPPLTSNSNFTAPDQIEACNIHPFSTPLLTLQPIPRTQPSPPCHPSSSIPQLRLQTPELEQNSSYPVPSLNSSPISHSSPTSYDQIPHLDLKPNLDDYNSTLVHQSQPLQSPLSPQEFNLNLHFHLNSFEPFNSNSFHQNQSFQPHPNPLISNQSSVNYVPKPHPKLKQNEETQYKSRIQTQRTKSNQSQGQSQPEKKYGCLICNKHFARAFNLQTHIATHKGIKPFKCPTPSCSKSFSRRHDLSRHLNSLHSNWLNSLKLNSNQIVSKLKLDDHDKLLFKTCSNLFQI